MLRLQLKLSVLLVALLVLAGCAPRISQDGASRGRLPDLEAPQFAVAAAGAVIDSFNPPGSGARVRVLVPVQIVNPNPFPVTVRSMDLQFSLGAAPEQALSGSPNDVTVPANSAFELSLELSRGLRQDAELLRQVAATFSGEPMALSLSGSYRYSSELHPWQTAGQVSLTTSARAGGAVELPQLELMAAESSAFYVAGDTPLVRVTIDVHNTGSVGYLLYAKDLLLRISGQEMALYDLPPTPVPARSSTRIALNFEPTPPLLSQASRTALSDALAGDRARLTVQGQFALDVLGLGSWLLPEGSQLDAVIHDD